MSANKKFSAVLSLDVTDELMVAFIISLGKYFLTK